MFYRIALSSGLGLVLTALAINYSSSDHSELAGADVQGMSVADDRLSQSLDVSDTKQSQENQKALLADLKQAREAVGKMQGYEARFIRQIRKDDVLRDAEEIDLKLRHHPMSVYLRWKKTGKEALYVQGQNDDKLLVKLDEGLLSFAGTLAIQPDEEKAMKDSRYPITKIGLLQLVERILKENKGLELKKTTCKVQNEFLDDMACVCYTIEFSGPDVHPEYSKTVLHICEESKLPVCIASYGWDDRQPGGLVERYEYRDVKANQNLTDKDFDSANEAYNFE
ncbi:hypothetical protein CA54_31870 [Symmachiella macrocystis]|uniref:DUF1571 domain-containing protein n=1 Tax=Symmachiella macrocystis TaxID=2527985 RepID=A0A5C6BRJ5_9PLAN|nr:DUF1571 domain-containing protein [Symmachiella macrocystis]TWU14342.1 hypothetical protein CA54_31870 [Symmachiella macrocystis]